MGTSARKKCLSRTGWVTAVVVMLAVTACQSKDGASVGSSSVTAESTSAGDAGQPVGAATPGDAVAVWVTHILLEEYTEACWLSATVAAEETGEDAETLCASGGSGIEAATQLREAWVKPGVVLPPDAEVVVDEVEAQGDAATVPDTAVRVGGRSLREIELIGASGDTDSFELSLQVRKQDGFWYVAGMNISA